MEIFISRLKSSLETRREEEKGREGREKGTHKPVPFGAVQTRRRKRNNSYFPYHLQIDCRINHEKIMLIRGEIHDEKQMLFN